MIKWLAFLILAVAAHAQATVTLGGFTGPTGATGAAGGAGGAGSYRELVVQYAGTATVTVTAAALDLVSGSGGITTLLNISLLPNTGTSGALGLDTGSVTINSKLAIWVIEKPDLSANTAIFSLSSTYAGLTLPSGYSGGYGRRVGWCFTAHTTTALIAFVQIADHFRYNIDTSAVTTSDSCRIVNGATTQTFTAQSLGARVPSTSVIVDMRVTEVASSGSTTVQAYLRPTGTTQAANTYFINTVPANAQIVNEAVVLTNSAQSIDYRNNVANNQLYLDINGYWDNL